MNPKPTRLLPLVFALAFSTAAFATDVTVQLSNVHLCCNSCVKGVDKTVAAVNGASSTCDKDAESFQVTGEFKPTDVFNALHEAGLAGKAEKIE